MYRLLSFVVSSFFLFWLISCNSSIPAPLSLVTTESPIIIQTVPATPTWKENPSNTPKSYILSFLAFHDFNGNGKQDDGEPNLKGVINEIAGKSCTTDVDGKCEIDITNAGNYKIQVTDGRDVKPDEKMRFILLSNSNFIEIESVLRINVSADSIITLALGHGYLTLPYPPSFIITHITYEDFFGNSFDNIVRDWRGITKLRLQHDASETSVYDWHTGWDIGYGDNAELCDMPIYAAAPGEVISLGPIGSIGGGSVRLLHSDDRMTDYAHLGEIAVNRNQIVKRGQYLGKTFCDWAEPHLHWELIGKPGEGRLQWDFWRVSICRDSLDTSSLDFLITDCTNQPYADEYFE